MLDHLFDIDGNAKTAFEKVDFAAQELRIDGQVVWKRGFGLAPKIEKEWWGEIVEHPCSEGFDGTDGY